jgi:hypothetical protein
MRWLTGLHAPLLWCAGHQPSLRCQYLYFCTSKAGVSISTFVLVTKVNSAAPVVCGRRHLPQHVSIRQHTSAYVSIRQHTSEYVSMRQHACRNTSAYVSILSTCGVRSSTLAAIVAQRTSVSARRPLRMGVAVDGARRHSFNILHWGLMEP